eukprot:18056-Prymnesium_polylepis.3
MSDRPLTKTSMAPPPSPPPTRPPVMSAVARAPATLSCSSLMFDGTASGLLRCRPGCFEQ